MRQSMSHSHDLSILDSPEPFDVCIIGSGFVGTILGTRLAEAGVRTLVLESGGSLARWLVDGRLKALAAYEVTGDANYPAVRTKARAVGGNSNFWTGRCERYHPTDFAERVRRIAQGFTNRSAGIPEETPGAPPAPVGHAVFAPEASSHAGWFEAEKITRQICDDQGPNTCAWSSAPLAVALKAWLELNATVICVEQDEPGVDADRPLTTWSETTPGPFLDARCGISIGDD